MEKDDRILNPSEANSIISDRLPLVQRSVVGLINTDDKGRVLSKASGILVQIAGTRYVFTARHVVFGKIKKRTTRLILPSLKNNKTAIAGLILLTPYFQIKPENMVWCDEQLDAAALEIPGLMDLSPELFIDGDKHAEITRTEIKILQKDVAPEGLMIPFTIHGYPNFGQFDDNEKHIQIVSCYSSFVEVANWSRDYWSPLDRKAPKCYFDLSLVDNSVLDPNSNAWEKYLAEAVTKDPSKEKHEAFGGFSGGPIFCHFINNDVLVAIVTDGGRFMGEIPRVIGTPWDDIHTAFEHSTRSL